MHSPACLACIACIKVKAARGSCPPPLYPPNCPALNLFAPVVLVELSGGNFQEGEFSIFIVQSSHICIVLVLLPHPPGKLASPKSWRPSLYSPSWQLRTSRLGMITYFPLVPCSLTSSGCPLPLRDCPTSAARGSRELDGDARGVGGGDHRQRPDVRPHQ